MFMAVLAWQLQRRGMPCLYLRVIASGCRPLRWTHGIHWAARQRQQELPRAENRQLRVGRLCVHLNGKTGERCISSRQGMKSRAQPVSKLSRRTCPKPPGSAEVQAAELSRRLMKHDRQIIREREEKRDMQYERDYKRATRKWISTMIALPIAIVTSYYLFDRRKNTLACNTHAENSVTLTLLLLQSLWGISLRNSQRTRRQRKELAGSNMYASLSHGALAE